MNPTLPHVLVTALMDRYALERELGRGGMAAVFLGRDLRHDRQVAVKVLHTELAAALEDHEPPHFHAFYSGSKAQLRIDPIGVLRGDLPPRSLALIVEWASLHRAELLANWDRLRREKPPVRIPPLE